MTNRETKKEYRYFVENNGRGDYKLEKCAWDKLTDSAFIVELESDDIETFSFLPVEGYYLDGKGEAYSPDGYHYELTEEEWKDCEFDRDGVRDGELVRMYDGSNHVIHTLTCSNENSDYTEIEMQLGEKISYEIELQNGVYGSFREGVYNNEKCLFLVKKSAHQLNYFNRIFLIDVDSIPANVREEFGVELERMTN